MSTLNPVNPLGRHSGAGRNDVIISNGQSRLNKAQRGFSIVTAIFLLVVLSFLGVAMVTFSTTQHQSSAMDVMGSRAYQAARAGIEWGAYQVLQNGGACAVSVALPAMTGTLSGFTGTVTCASTPYDEGDRTVAGGNPLMMYQITSTASQGTLGTPSYVERQMTVTIAAQ